MNRRPAKSRSGYDSFSPQHTAHFKASSPDTSFFEPKKRRSMGRRVLLALLGVLLLTLAGNFIANRFVHVRRVSVPVTGLTEAFDGYTVLHISDLKGASFGGDQSLLTLALGSAQYDVVLLSGDMVSPLGNAQPFYALIEALRAQRPGVPIYFIAGDSDPTPLSMDYAAGGSPFAPWVLGAQQRGAVLLSAPQPVEREGQTLWLTTTSHLNLDLDTMQRQYEQSYLRAQAGGDENEIELATYNLSSLSSTREARARMQEGDVYITLTHAPPAAGELTGAQTGLTSRVDLVLCGHYLGGMLRLPLLGAVFIPSQDLPHYGLFPGAGTYCGLSRLGRAWVYASPGLGSRDPLYPPFFFRLFNPPAVTLLSLTPSAL